MTSFRRRPVVTGAHETIPKPRVTIDDCDDESVVVVTEAYGPQGHNLVGLSDVTFDGHPAITLMVRIGELEELIHLSPITGDNRKDGFTDIPERASCELLCPISQLPLEIDSELSRANYGTYALLYLTANRNPQDVVAIGTQWGHPHTRVMNYFELLSTWFESD